MAWGPYLRARRMGDPGRQGAAARGLAAGIGAVAAASARRGPGGPPRAGEAAALLVCHLADDERALVDLLLHALELGLALLGLALTLRLGWHA
jgi:hypothetical protein